MNQKRKFDSDSLRITIADGLKLLVPLDENFSDSSDEELSDSGVHDNIEDDFDELNLSSDVEIDESEDEKQWEDISDNDNDSENDSENEGNNNTNAKELNADSQPKEKTVSFSLCMNENERVQKSKVNGRFLQTENCRILDKNALRKERYKKKPSVGHESISDLETKESSNIKERTADSKSNSDTLKKQSVEASDIKEIKEDEYADDSSDEEDLRNTIGNIPINWYDEYPHLGYGLDSLPIMKPDQGDTLDKFLDKLENPDYYRTVFDKQTGQQVKLSDEHLDFIRRVMNYKIPDANYDLYEPFLDLYSHEVMEMPLSGRPEHKRSFIPSKAERQKVVKLATLIKRGLLRKRKLKNPQEDMPKFYDIWKPRSKEEGKVRGITDHIPAPKMPLPGHRDSYNPAPEYLVKKSDYMIMKGRKIKDNELFDGFWRKFSSIREIPMYPKTVQERFERLMDLYITPRKKYQKVVAKSSDFLPNLPDKKDLRPYPTMEELVFRGHRSIIRTLSVHPGGKFLASGSDDHTVKIWEISTGRCLRTFDVEEAPKTVSWNPNAKLFLLGLAMGRVVVFMNPENHLLDKVVVQQTNSVLKEEVNQGDYIAPDRITDAVTWRKPTEQEYMNGYRLVIEHFKEVKQIIWHKQGDYFATVIPEGDNRSVLMHQLSRWRTQVPFSKNKGRIQTVAFHPKLPQLFVVTQSHIRLYDLQKQGLLKKVQANSRWVSCIDLHPGGEHFIIGGYDRRINWFEMEYTKRPHLMRYHVEAVRSVKFHRKYPLFASCSDDGRVVVCHGMVYDDWLKDPLIVPLKQLKGHDKFDGLYVLDLAWHPFEPYLLTAGADGTIRLWH